ncbi:MAG: thiamine-phosphate kinase [Variibacter sp.]
MTRRSPASLSGEDRLIARHFAPLATHRGALKLTDDAAFIAPPAGHELVVTVDALIAGVHFFPDDPADLIARKALRVNLSDLAAKGATPEGFLVALGLPKGIDDAWIARFAKGLAADAKEFRCPLLGGDSVRSPERVMVSVTAFGSLPRGTMVRRQGARPGDIVFVTGTVGDGALGLMVRKGEATRWGLSRAAARHLTQRYLLPQPRNAIAETLRRHASAAMDVSDGLAGDLAKLCRVSGASAEIQVADIPLSPAAKSTLRAEPSLQPRILGGGDDYEIVCAVPPRRASAFLAQARKAGVRVSGIGRIVKGSAPPRFLDAHGAAVALKAASFSHF